MTCPYHCNHGRIFNTVLKTYQPCPHCASVIKEIGKPSTDTENPEQSTFDILTKLGVPEQYRNARFNPDTFFTGKAEEIFARSTFVPVLEQLSAINTAIMDSHILLESCYFYVGIYAAIYDYVYDCLISAVKHGLTAVPYTSLKDLQGIRNNTSQMSKLYSNLTWYDYTSADICFLAATASADSNEAVILADLLHERARRALPTYVFGYWTQDALSKSKSGLYYLIDSNSKLLSLLKPYEIWTLYKYSNSGILGTVDKLGMLGVEEEKPVRDSAYGLGVSVDKYTSH